MTKNDDFSMLCSDMLRIVRECREGDTHNDPISRYYGFGTEPCGPWPPRSLRLRAIGRLSQAGYTLGSFFDELERRTSARWVHFGPLSYLECFAELMGRGEGDR